MTFLSSLVLHQAPSADAQLDETPADRLPQTELLSTQVLDEAMPPLQASLQASTATLTLSQPADELPTQEAPDALMHEADDAHELPLLSTVQSAGNGTGGLSALDAMQSVGDEAALREATMAEAAEPTPAERVVASSSLRQSPVERELASGVETLDAALAAAPDQAAGGVPSASPFPRSLASSAAGETLRRPFDLASAVAAAQLVQQPEQFAAFAAEPQPEQPPLPPSAQRSARADGRVEPPAEGRAEPALQSAAPPRLTLDQARGLRTATAVRTLADRMRRCRRPLSSRRCRPRLANSRHVPSWRQAQYSALTATRRCRFAHRF